MTTAVATSDGKNWKLTDNINLHFMKLHLFHKTIFAVFWVRLNN